MIARLRNALRQVARELQLFLRGFTRGGVDVVKKVLVVDDSQAEIRLLQSVLQQGGFHSVAISDPTRIEETIEEERPNVILLDVVMPQRNGFQVCRDLKNQESYSQDSGDSGDVEDRAERPLLGRAAGRQRLRRQAVHAG